MSTKVTLDDMSIVEKVIESAHNVADTIVVSTKLMSDGIKHADAIIRKDWELPSRKVNK